MKNFIIVFLCVMTLGLGGYLVYDKVLSANNEVNKNSEEVNENDDEANEEQKVESALVSDFVNSKIIQTYTYTGQGTFQIQENEIPYVDVAIPYVNVDNIEAERLNEIIQNDFNEVINIIKNNITEQKTNKGPYYTVVNYNYTVRKNILFIYVHGSGAAYRAGGSTWSKSYYYDLENNAILNAKDVLNKLSMRVEGITHRLCSDMNKTEEEILNNLDSNISIFIVGNSVFILPTQQFTFNSFEIGDLK